MAILTAEYSNFNETSILVTYDDGRPDQIVPDNLANRDRQEVLEWENLPNTITPFADVAANLTRAKSIASDKVQSAFLLSQSQHDETDGANTFTMTPAVVGIINASLNMAVPAGINLVDTSNVVQAVSVVGQQTLLANFTTSTQTDLSNLQSAVAAVQAGVTVNDVTVALQGTGFGDLSPIFDTSV